LQRPRFDCGGDDLLVQIDPQPPIDPGLRMILDKWADLPEPIRAGILAMVKAIETGRADGG